MKSTVWKVSLAIAGALVVLLAWHVYAQRVPPAGVPPGPPMMGPFMPPGPGQVAMVVGADGTVFVACDGTIAAFAPHPLRKLSEATYWGPPAEPMAPPAPPRGPERVK